MIILKLFLCILCGKNKFWKKLSDTDLKCRELIKSIHFFSSIFITYKTLLTDRFNEWKLVQQHVMVHNSWAKFKWRTISNIAENNYNPNQVKEHCDQITSEVKPLLQSHMKICHIHLKWSSRPRAWRSYVLEKLKISSLKIVTSERSERSSY